MLVARTAFAQADDVKVDPVSYLAKVRLCFVLCVGKA